MFAWNCICLYNKYWGELGGVRRTAEWALLVTWGGVVSLLSLSRLSMEYLAEFFDSGVTGEGGVCWVPLFRLGGEGVLIGRGETCLKLLKGGLKGGMMDWWWWCVEGKEGWWGDSGNDVVIAVVVEGEAIGGIMLMMRLENSLWLYCGKNMFLLMLLVVLLL